MHVRALTAADVDVVLDLANREAIRYLGVPDTTAEELKSMIDGPEVDPANDAWAYEVDGRLVAVSFARSSPPYVEPLVITAIDPDEDRPDLRAAVAEHALRQVDRFRALADPSQTFAIRFGSYAADPAWAAHLEAAGFRTWREFWRMRRMFDGAPEVTPLPDGFELRPYGRADDRATYDALDEAFEDHVGRERETFEEWQHVMFERFSFDPELWVVAWDGDSVAGALCAIAYTPDFPDCGYVTMFGVRRAYRGRGLGLALLTESFARFHARGLTGAGLHVDAESETGATRLYERAGMTAEPCYRSWLREDASPAEDAPPPK